MYIDDKGRERHFELPEPTGDISQAVENVRRQVRGLQDGAGSFAGIRIELDAVWHAIAQVAAAIDANDRTA